MTDDLQEQIRSLRAALKKALGERDKARRENVKLREELRECQELWTLQLQHQFEREDQAASPPAIGQACSGSG